MAGTIDLWLLIAGMSPRLHPGVFVFAALPPGSAMPPHVEPVMIFRESEGVTLILEEGEARKAELAGTFRCRMVTLEIHSSLDAVGFLGAITTRLAMARISVNPVSAFHHDHLFVPIDRAEEVLLILEQLASQAAKR